MKRGVITDTSDFFSITYGDVMEIGGRRYRVLGHARELRFGIEDPKFWVKRVVDMETDENKIVKLSFFESFTTSLGGVNIRCFRSPEKERDILALVRDHPNFMQGETHRDAGGNWVRVLDVVRGATFLDYIHSFRMKYGIYMRKILPGILKKLIKAFEAIRFLHANGYRHGDIRNDHIIVDKASGAFVWIDFDYDFEATENPFSLDIFGLGNLLIYAIGKGFHNAHDIKNDAYTYKDLRNRLEPDDFAILERRRFINLRKLHPIIPEPLNNVLMHFSRGANVYYEWVDEIIEDLNRSLRAFEEI